MGDFFEIGEVLRALPDPQWRTWQPIQRFKARKGQVVLAVNARGERAVLKWVSFTECPAPPHGSYKQLPCDYADEATIPMALSGHPNIVACHAYELLHRKHTTELVLRTEECVPLRTHLNAQSLCAQEVVRIGNDLTNALAAMAAKGLAHRDIGMGNVFFSNGHYRLGDFGAAYRSYDVRDDGFPYRSGDLGSLRSMLTRLVVNGISEPNEPSRLQCHLALDWTCLPRPIDPALWELITSIHFDPPRTLSDFQARLRWLQADLSRRKQSGVIGLKSSPMNCQGK